VAATSNVEVNLDTVIWTGRRFLATGEGVLISSPNGTIWTPVALPVRRSIRSLVARGGSVLGVGDADSVIRATGGGPFKRLRVAGA
jgi:hypothetical protein